MKNSKSRSSRPPWAIKIETLRHARKVNQSEFGSQLGISAMGVSRWERGVAEPAGEVYIRLGNLAGDPLCWFFWKQAGLRLSDVTRVLPSVRQRLARTTIPELHVVHAGSSKQASLKKESLVAIPFLPVRAGTAGSAGDNVDLAEVQPESMMAAPLAWCPHPDATVCLQVKGDSMAPLILDGYIVAVDTSEVINDSVVGDIVVASHDERGLLLSRLIRFDHTDALVSDNREYESVRVTPGSKWRIVGKVLWWTGRAR